MPEQIPKTVCVLGMGYGCHASASELNFRAFRASAGTFHARIFSVPPNDQIKRCTYRLSPLTISLLFFLLAFPIVSCLSVASFKFFVCNTISNFSRDVCSLFLPCPALPCAAVRCSTVPYCAVLCGPVLCCAVLCCAVLCCAECFAVRAPSCMCYCCCRIMSGSSAWLISSAQLSSAP